ncbi:MAG: hypothetical protein ACOY3X_02720 [Pseudomonadota bacterium]
MGVEWVAGLLVVFAVLCLGGAAWLFFRETWFLQWLRGTAGFLLAAAALYAVLIAASLFKYQGVRSDVPMATLSFENMAPQQWRITIAESNGDRRVHELQGDLWQLDVRLLRYKGLGAMFDTPPSFELERLSGRYFSLEDEAAKDHGDFLLVTRPALGFDMWESTYENGSAIAEASRTNVSMVPAADGAIFELRMGETGLAVVPANSAAEDALKSVGN